MVNKVVYISTGLTDNNKDELISRYNKLVQLVLYKIDIIVHEFVFLQNNTESLGWLCDEIYKETIYQSAAKLQIRKCDMVVFPNDWKDRKICVIEHGIADQYDIPCFIESDNSDDLICDKN